MRAAWLAFMLGCGGAAATQAPAVAPEEPAGPRAVFADDDPYRPSYGTRELARVLADERTAAVAAEQRIAELTKRAELAGSPALDDQLHVATADLAVRRRFIATLEVCEAHRRWCPPRLDDPAWAFDPDPDQPAPPPMTAALQHDLAGWRALADELHGRACACRIQHCVDSVGAAIVQLEAQTAPAVAGDELASLAITRARECLVRLHGKAAMPR